MIDDKKNIGSNLESILELAVSLGQINEFIEIVRLVKTKALTLVNAEKALVIMVNPRTRHTHKTIHSKDTLSNTEEHILHTNITGWVFKKDQIFISNDLQNDNRFHKSLLKNIPVHNAVCLPLKVEGFSIGSLLIENKKNSEQFTDSDISILEYLAAVSSPFLHNVQKVEQYFIPRLPGKSLIIKYESFGLLGKSQKFKELLKSIEAAARSDVRVSLIGQSGTGKELVVKAIHHLSSRHSCKFYSTRLRGHT